MNLMAIVLTLTCALGLSAAGAQTPAPTSSWGDDVLIWSMAGQNSTWAGLGHKSSDLVCCDSRIYAVSVREGPSNSYFGGFYSEDGGASWSLAANITSTSFLYDPDICLNGTQTRVLFFTAARQQSSTGSPLMYSYQLPDFTDFQFEFIDWPAEADTITSVEVERSASGDRLWLFAADVSGNVFLGTSDDDGVSWSAMTPVASGGPRISASAGSGDEMFLAYQDDSDNSIYLQRFYEPGTWDQYLVGDGADQAAPTTAVEMSGSQPLFSVAYRDGSGTAILRTSSDGSSWNEQQFSEGYYPFVDVARDTTLAAISYLAPNGSEILVRSAGSLSLLSGAEEQAVTDFTPFASAPAVVRRIPCNNETGLLYQQPASNGFPSNLIFDTTLQTGLEEGEEQNQQPLGVWPNPVAGVFTASFSLPGVQQVSLAIHSLDGRMVASLYSGHTDSHSVQADLNLPAGVYTVVLRSDSGVYSRRLVSL